MLIIQYQKLLDALDISNLKTFFDAGYGDGTFLKFFSNKYPNLELFGIDVSKEAKDKIKIDGLINENLFVGDFAKMDISTKYDIVHNFDVLYHILDDNEFEHSLNNLCTITNKYLIIHDRFLKKPQKFTKSHVRMRVGSALESIISDHGLKLHSQVATHFIAMRPSTYLLNRFISKQMFGIDQYLSQKLSEEKQLKLGTHFIRVYER